MDFKKTICGLLLFGLAISLSAQIKTPGFAKYLISLGAYEEVIDLQEISNNRLSVLQEDSIDFYHAWSLFHLQRIPEAVIGFKTVSEKSSFFYQSAILSSWSNLYLGKPDLAIRDIESTPGIILHDSEVYRLQKAAIHLRQRKFELANKELSDILNSGPFYVQSGNDLQRMAEEALNFKAKSMVVSGILSGIIPGAGKIYAGEKGAGISSFLILAGLGGIAAENIIKSGIESWNSIFFTGLFSIFYLGNIYGSVISIKTYRQRFYEGFDQAVVATVLLPLRDYYR